MWVEVGKLSWSFHFSITWSLCLFFQLSPLLLVLVTLLIIIRPPPPPPPQNGLTALDIASFSNEANTEAVCELLHMYMEESAPVQSHHVRDCFTVLATNYCCTLLYRILLSLPHRALPRMELTGKEDSLQ